MGDSKKVTIKLDEKTDIVINKFKGETWVHVFQRKKNKNISLNKTEMKMFFAFQTKILKAIRHIDKSEPLLKTDKKHGKPKQKARAKRHHSRSKSPSDTESNSTMEFSDEEEEESGGESE